MRLGLLQEPLRHLFFAGKGGVGKTSLACAIPGPAASERTRRRLAQVRAALGQVTRPRQARRARRRSA
jgi:anion-transporting  ArsA/GET3 family ATPase